MLLHNAKVLGAILRRDQEGGKKVADWRGNVVGTMGTLGGSLGQREGAREKPVRMGCTVENRTLRNDGAS